MISQNPPAMTVVAVGTAIDITVSNGKVNVPGVVGESQAQAQSDLANAGFQVSIVTQENGSATAGTVLAQTPLPGTAAVKGTLVTITVATAPPPPPTSPTASPLPSAT